MPYETILEKFQQRHQEKPDENYSKFLIGIVPGGAVSVWIAGTRTVEVFFGRAEKIEMTPTAAFRLPFESKEESDGYVERAMAESVTPEQLQLIKTKGAPIGMWARYRNLYKWAPAYKDGKSSPRPSMPVHFLNGEFDRIPTYFNEELANTPRPLPSRLTFRAQVTPDEKPVYIIDFDPVELMEAFEKLGSHGEKVFIEFDAQIPVTNMKIRVYNDTKPKDEKTPKQFIELKKFKVDP